MKTIYRIEHRDTKDGMWYNYNGSYNGAIFDLTEGLSKNIPMPYTEHHKKDNKKWFSAVKSIDDLFKWFTSLDIQELLGQGYELYKITCINYNDIGSEVLFAREDIVKQEIVNINSIINNFAIAI